MRLFCPILFLLYRPSVVLLFRVSFRAGARAARVQAGSKVMKDSLTECCCKEKACDNKHNDDRRWHNWKKGGKEYCCKHMESCDWSWGWGYKHASGDLQSQGKIDADDGCGAPACPAGTQPDGDDCACKDGTSGRSSYDWQTSTWSAVQCEPTSCPTNAEGSPCKCKHGYRGEVTWNKITQTWKSTCSKERCPGESRGHPDCKCPAVGYKGYIHWSENDRVYRGYCSRVHCPLPATNHPECTCPQGYKGSIAWDNDYKVFTGTCTPTWTYVMPKEEVAHKSCEYDIHDAATCKIAADELGLRHAGVKIVQHEATLPPGCFLQGGRLRFSPVDSSYHRRSDGRHHRYSKGVQQICGGTSMPSKCTWNMFAAAGPKFHDVQQGDIGTCYFLASVAAIAHSQPQLIEQMFVSKGCVTYTKSGRKCVFPFVYDGNRYESCTNVNHTAAWCATKVDSSGRLANGRAWDFCTPNADEACKSEASKYERLRSEWMINGQLVTVAIDDKVPANELGHPHFVKYNSGHHFWPIVLEKAWAKIYGSFKNVEHGIAVEGLLAITKSPVNQIKDIYLMKLGDLWKHLMYMLSMSAPCVANTRKIEGRDLHGLPADHSFTFIDARKLADGQYVVQMYNPWGRNKYNGELRNMIGHDATFFMTLQEFHDAIFELNYAFFHPGYRSSSQAIPVQGSFLNVKLRFDMKDDSKFWYMVTWPTARLVTAKSNCTHESLVMPKLKSYLQFFGADEKNNAWSTNFSQVTTGHAWRKINGQAGAGYYTLTLEVDFDKITWVPEVSVVVFAKEAVPFRILAMEGDPDGVNDSDSECSAFVNRVKDLDNHKEIQASGVDKKFPPVEKSIGSGNCGDPAQSKQMNSCDIYDHWTTLDEVACPSR